jgi:hypothetical protein
VRHGQQVLAQHFAVELCEHTSKHGVRD